jgi:Uma2 family endonuclease
MNLPQPKIKMSLEEFRQLPETTQRMELIHGELITQEHDALSPAVKDKHQGCIVSATFYFGQFRHAGTLRVAPTDLYIGENVLQPDLFWISNANTNCLLGEDGYWHGAPDLAIEILSPSTAERDRGAKFDLYEQYGVREYWLIDAEFVEIYIAQAGVFKRLGVFGVGKTFESTALGGHRVSISELLDI